ncbi:MAG: glutamyl-tRNA reductase [Elusimicrobia bacterium]|nr:glutamyl-tRNA reductase [Elusimicrobiota bacterium]MDE2236385.1 glutamyl-tRNA reductase [Elusimicrobiota bacterium]MDE2426000.1 glutamyl-tRNA reductase [Elusimicrobiota bacterium]
MSELFKVGFSHLSAPLKERERASVPEVEVAAQLPGLARELGVSELVLLSTCSRLEIYGVAPRAGQAAGRARAWFLRRGGPGLEGSLGSLLGNAALGHLFRVAAGLDSWIIGESEVLGQVKRAYEAARAAKMTGPWLNRCFQSALAAGKSARARTGIQNGVSSIGGAAAALARQIFGSRDDGSIVVFGAGEAAEAVARHLAVKNFKDISVANRTPERAEELARRIGGRPMTFAEGLELLARAEVGVFSTASPAALLQAEMLRGIVARRRRPLFLIDLGMPRNVDPGCAAVSGAYLYDLDDLKQVVARSVEAKAKDKAAAESLVSEAASRCALELDKAAAFARPREAVA